MPKVFYFQLKSEYRFSRPESQNGLSFNLKFANINFLHVRKQSFTENLDTSHQQDNSFSLTRRYFQGNSETCLTEIIQKRGIVFHDNENLTLLLISDGKI